MFQKDYLLRMIEQFTKMLAKIIGLDADDKIEEKQQIINDALKDFTGMSEAGIESLAYKDLINLVSGFKEVNPEKCFMLAELIKTKADVYDRLNDVDRSFNLYLKSFNIYVEVLLSSQSAYLAPNEQTIEQTINKIRPFKLPDETDKLLFLYYERIMKYDLAENILFERLAENNYLKSIVTEGTAFYERLIKKTNTELEKGNLPIDEVLESMEKIRNYRESAN